MMTSRQDSLQRPENCNRHTEEPHGRRLPAVLPGMEGLLQQCVAAEGNYFEGDHVEM